MDHRQIKDRLYSLWSDVGKALSSPKRLELLDLIAQGERTVDELARECGLSVNNTSSHLSVLRAAHLIEARKQSQSVYHRLAGNEVVLLLRMLQAVARVGFHEVEHLARTFLEGRDELEPLTAGELRDRLRSGKVTLIDVRPEIEYLAGHIEGALSVPLDRLNARLRDLPRGQPVVAYCRGPYCLFAVDAVQRLRKKGYPSLRLSDGYPDWAAAGLPIATGDEFAETVPRRSRLPATSKSKRRIA